MAGGTIWPMDVAEQKLLERLAKRQIDPRKGIGLFLGLSRPYLASTFFLAWLGGGCIPVLSFGLLPAHANLWILLALGVIVLLRWLIPRRIRIRTEARCKEQEYFLCPWCRYGLIGLPDAGRCPECGKRYERSNCYQLYRNAYGPEPFADVLRERDHKAWAEAIEMQGESADVE